MNAENMGRAWCWILFFLIPCILLGDNERKFEGDFWSRDNHVTLHLNLYDTVLVVPRFEFLGKMNGYMDGNIHETWFVTSFSIKNNNVVLSLSNELGSESQDVIFSQVDSIHYKYETSGPNVVRKVENKKWVKLPSVMLFERVHFGNKEARKTSFRNK